MEKKEIRKHIVIITVIFLVSAFLPALISIGTERLVGQLQNGQVGEEQSQQKEGMGKMSVSIPDLEREQPDINWEEQEETDILSPLLESYASDNTSSYEQELETYRKSIQPDLSETHEGTVGAFVGERKEEFITAIADYVFSIYGDSLLVTRIDVIELVKDDETEMVYQIEVFATEGGKEYSELFISSYNKEWDFYSIYPYSVR